MPVVCHLGHLLFYNKLSHDTSCANPGPRLWLFIVVYWCTVRNESADHCPLSGQACKLRHDSIPMYWNNSCAIAHVLNNLQITCLMLWPERLKELVEAVFLPKWCSDLHQRDNYNCWNFIDGGAASRRLPSCQLQKFGSDVLETDRNRSMILNICGLFLCFIARNSFTVKLNTMLPSAVRPTTCTAGIAITTAWIRSALKLIDRNPERIWAWYLKFTTLCW